MRVTARLIDAETGVNLWSGQYDRPAEKLLDVQDEITQRIAVTLTGWQGEINEAERAIARRKSESELDPYDYWLLGIEAKHRMTPDGIAEARRYFSKGLELAPNFVPLVRDFAITYCVEMDLGSPIDFPAAVQAHKEYTERAFSLDPGDDNTNAQMGLVYNMQGDSEQAEIYSQRALDLGPGNSDVAFEIAWIWAGWQPERAIPLMEKTLKANPRYPAWWNFPMAEAYFAAGRFEDAFTAASRAGESPNQSAFLAMAAAQTGRADIAAKAAANTLRLNPSWTAESMFPYQVFANDAPLIESATKAGLPICMDAAEAAQFSGSHRLDLCENQRAGIQAETNESAFR
jgi:hypothetical protein